MRLRLFCIFRLICLITRWRSSTPSSTLSRSYYRFTYLLTYLLTFTHLLTYSTYQQLRTTKDIECPQWFDWFHGGLQFQAIHHLFPRIPRHNLRRVQGKVMKLCKDWVRYTSYHSLTQSLTHLYFTGHKVRNYLVCRR